MRIIAVGDNCIDYYTQLNRWYPTGNCVDFAVVLSDLGAETAIVTGTGTDAYGDSIVKLLQDHHMDTSHVHRIDCNTSVVKMTLVGESGKDRLHGEYLEGAIEQFHLSDDDIAFIDQFDLIHTVQDGYMDEHLSLFKKMQKKIVYDFTTYWKMDRHEAIERYVDYGFFSYTQEDEQIRSYLKEACGNGLEIAVATLGDSGSIACDGEDFYRQGIVKVDNLVNTAGAGDSYIAGFIYGLSQGKTIQECMQCGSEIASRIIQVFEPYEGYSVESKGEKEEKQ